MTTPRLVGTRYELGELIGYGGMAEVHRGRDVRLGREVAIKVLRADLARDQSFLNRFRREAQAAAGLNHPAIVAVYDTGEDVSADGSVPFIVMEYVEGRTLRDVLKVEGRLPAHRAMEIAAEVCGALDFSHRNGIVHRDIKPANVMITATGAVKVMDFGIARALSDNAATVTQTAAVIGTAQYLSPEQARGESVDARSDVYSVGCLLYELVTGHPPFTGDSPVAVAYQHVRETPPVPSSVSPDVPRALDSIVMKALAKNPLNRYQSAGEMRSDLQRALADRPVEAEAVLTDAEKTQLISRVPVPPRAGPPPVGVRRDDGDGRGPVEEDHGRRNALIWTAVVVALLLVIGGGAYAIVTLGKSDKPKTYALPSVINQTPAAAVATLRGQGFTNVAEPTTYGGACGANPKTDPVTVAEGKICTETPAPNTKISKDTLIKLTTYKKPSVQLKNYVGLQYAEASNQLVAAGLKPQKVDTPSAKAAGTVIGQDPAPFKTVAPNSPVKLQVSTGEVVLPDVRGKSESDAVATLNGQGWTNIDPSRTQTGTDKSKDGIVIGESPVPGNPYPQQTTTIHLTIYHYKAPPTHPTTPTTTPPTSPSGSTSGTPSGSSPSPHH